MIKKILFDCERMKYPNTGLYYFCMQLGGALLKNANPLSEEISFYMPKKEINFFGETQTYLEQNSLHKFLFPSVKDFHIWHSTYQASGYSPRSKKIKRVVTVHDLNFLYEHANNPSKISASLKKIQSQISIADRICAISAYVKKDVETHLELKGKDVEVIYNGCNINPLPFLRDPLIKPDKPFIFSVGTIMAKKNFHVLPALLVNNNKQLIIAGIVQQEWYKNKIEKVALELGVAERVVFAGAISENDKQWYLQNCEAFAFPSVAEGFGLPVVEAMAFGKPVFLSAATSLPEIGGNAAYYFQNFQAEEMRNVFEEGMKHYVINQPQEQIKQRANLFNWDVAAKKYLEIYRSL